MQTAIHRITAGWMQMEFGFHSLFIIENSRKTIVKICRLFFCAFLRIIQLNKTQKDVIYMRETRTLEFKETITNTFLKTVSAFSNYDGGTIYFGIDDEWNIKG